MKYKVFIGYGKEQGRLIAEQLSYFLKQDDFETFVGSPTSGDIPAGSQELEYIINEMMSSDVAVMIVTKSTSRSKRWKYELQFIMEVVGLPVLPFVMRNAPLPILVRYYGLQYLSFEIESPQDSFPRVAIDLKRHIEAKRTPRRIKEEEVPHYE